MTGTDLEYYGLYLAFLAFGAAVVLALTLTAITDTIQRRRRTRR